jgi:hypothetical protein
MSRKKEREIAKHRDLIESCLNPQLHLQGMIVWEQQRRGRGCEYSSRLEVAPTGIGKSPALRPVSVGPVSVPTKNWGGECGC